MANEILGSRRWVRVLVGGLIGSVFGVLGLWAGLFTMAFTCVMLLAMSAVWWWVALSRGWLPFAVVLIFAVVLSPLGSVAPTEFVSAQSRMLTRSMDEGVDAIPATQLLAVSGLHRLLILGARVVGFDEVATEAAELHSDDVGERSFESDFAMRSPKVRAALQTLFLEHGVGGSVSRRLDRVKVSWRGYGGSSESLRVSLALNCPLELSGSVWVRAGRTWARMHAHCWVDYPEHSVIELGSFSGVDVHLDEGIFHVLEERDWLFPYEAVWRWEMPLDEPLLRDHTAVFRDSREQALMELAASLGL